MGKWGIIKFIINKVKSQRYKFKRIIKNKWKFGTLQ